MSNLTKQHDSIEYLMKSGFSASDAHELRRIAMTLHRWFELECGNSDNHSSWCLVRGERVDGEFVYKDDGAPFLERHWHTTHTTRGIRYEPVPDRERGAMKRLDGIMKRYPDHVSYVQTDPRGAPLYILRASDVPEGRELQHCYTRGVAVYK